MKLAPGLWYDCGRPSGGIDRSRTSGRPPVISIKLRRRGAGRSGWPAIGRQRRSTWKRLAVRVVGAERLIILRGDYGRSIRRDLIVLRIGKLVVWLARWRQRAEVAVGVIDEMGLCAIGKGQLRGATVGVACDIHSSAGGVGDALRETVHAIGNGCHAAAGSASLCDTSEPSLEIIGKGRCRETAGLRLHWTPPDVDNRSHPPPSW